MKSFALKAQLEATNRPEIQEKQRGPGVGLTARTRTNQITTHVIRPRNHKYILYKKK